MKKLLLITLALLSNFIFAQTQLSDYYDASAANRSEFSYNVVVRIQKNEGATSDAKRYTATLVQASPDPKGFYNANHDGKFYSCSQLGNVCNPNNYNRLSIKIFYSCNGQQKVTTVSLGSVNDQQFVPVVLGAGGSFCESIDFNSIEVFGAVLSPTHLEQIRVQINKLNAGSNPSSNSSGNPVSQTKATNTDIPANTSGNDPLAHFETDGKTLSNPMATKTSSGSGAVDSFNKGYQQGEQITEVATGIVDLFTPSPAQVAAKKAEYERQQKLADDLKWAAKEERFGKLYYDPLMVKANKGNEEARMILYFASYNLGSTKFVPERKEWFQQAFKNKNLDAISEMANLETKEGKEPINAVPYLKEAARLGSLDAMVELGKWYDSKGFTYDGITYIGGENAEKALAAFTEAAEKGSPNAMYYLGMIYKHGIIVDLSTGGVVNFRKKMHVTYAIAPDEKKAFEWFSKSLQPDYIASWYSKSKYYSNGSYFESNCYLELADMYRKGKVVAKDKDKAKAYEKLHEEYNSYENRNKRMTF
jgi:TPR repeat protein